MQVTFRIWRQNGPDAPGRFEDYVVDGVDPMVGLLDAIDSLNDGLRVRGKDPVEFAYACREGWCGQCSLFVNGRAHGPETQCTTCQARMSRFEEGSVITLEPFRAAGFPVIKDLKVDRSSLDRMIEAGGFMRTPTSQGMLSTETGRYHKPSQPKYDDDGVLLPDPSQCIACGACAAACPNASPRLFMAAVWKRQEKLEPTPPEEAGKRAAALITSSDLSGFGSCSDYQLCEAACPKNLQLDWITEFNRDYGRGLRRQLKSKKTPAPAAEPGQE